LLPGHLAGTLPREFVDRHVQRLEESHARFAIPDPTLHFMHVMVHAAIVDRAFARGTLSLRALRDTSILLCAYANSMDWDAIREWARTWGMEHVLVAWVYLAQDFFDAPARTPIPSTLRARVHARRVRAQAASPTAAALVRRVCSYSRSEVCARFGCSNDWFPVTLGRVRLAAVHTWRDLSRLW